MKLKNYLLATLVVVLAFSSLNMGIIVAKPAEEVTGIVKPERDDKVIKKVKINEEKKHWEVVFSTIASNEPKEYLEYDMKTYDTELFKSFVPADSIITQVLWSNNGVVTIDYRNNDQRIIVSYEKDGKVRKTVTNANNIIEQNFNDEEGKVLDNNAARLKSGHREPRLG